MYKGLTNYGILIKMKLRYYGNKPKGDIMVDYALITNPGGRDNNEDYVTVAKHDEDICFILCDGLGGHDRGEVASKCVAEHIASQFEKLGNTKDFFDDAIPSAQEKLLALQEEQNMQDAMKTTLVVLIVADNQIRWAHIGDSRLYRFYDNNTKYERTKDHSMVQMLCNMGEIDEKEIRTHEDRNKVLRVMGAPWGKKSYDKSAIIEREEMQAFALMTDGFWEYVYEEEMLESLRNTKSAEEWMKDMEKLVVERADMTDTDNYSIICVRLEA